MLGGWVGGRGREEGFSFVGELSEVAEGKTFIICYPQAKKTGERG